MNNIPSPLPKTSDDWLEHDIKAAGADVAPRVTLADLKANIAHVEYVKHVSHGGQVLRWAVITTKSGFAVVGDPSVSVSPQNDRAHIGEAVAFENSKNALWPLMGYALKERLNGLQAGDVADAKTSGFREGYASAKRGDPAPLSNGSEDFDLPAKACDLSGEGTCEACQ